MKQSPEVEWHDPGPLGQLTIFLSNLPYKFVMGGGTLLFQLVILLIGRTGHKHAQKTKFHI